MVTSESNLKTRELHKARREIDRYKEGSKISDSMEAQAGSVLANAKKTMIDLSSQIGESKSKTRVQKEEIEMLKESRRYGKRTLNVGSVENSQYAEVMRELETVKQKLSMLRLDMAAVSEEKSREEMRTEALGSKILSNLSTVKAIKQEIEKINEEHVLVELARIEALKEYGDIEAQRKKEAHQFSCEIEKTRNKVKDIMEMIDQSKELESKLAATLSDVDVIENELRLVKEMDKKVRRSESSRHLDSSFHGEQDLDASILLQSITKELEEAKKDLASVRKEGFQYMTSMDIIRNEMKHVKAEMSQLKKMAEKSDLTVKNLNSKLLRAKSKLGVVSAAEEKAKSIVSNLSLTLEQLKKEAQVSKKEKELIVRETATMKEEIQNTESKVDLTEEQLQATMQELQAAKLGEALAFEKLKSLTENTMRARACAPKNNSSITISKFEYEYLIGHAVGAKEIADKKVAAAQAWFEAIKASEKENLIKIDLAQREITKMRLQEEQEVYKIERSVSAKRMAEGELQKWKQKREKNAAPGNLQLSFPRKSMKGNANSTPSWKSNSNLTPSRKGNGNLTPSSKMSGNLTPSGRAKFRKSASPAGRRITIKKRTKVMLNLTKLFSGKKNDKDS
ncbi:protein PLASTID MOVEMENT IMPAIRED 2 [Ziziphus jujuba]|uniref:Protein PLASTID MOVEMENT IMPAIRED 2 n=1 Tax=Ziziphus jujuba TaxID=326968 RepID=A0A6P3ZJH0_ZIZJJ|nr:protein PLASTID MOVEMENT IMPAIRED 2 [Ziziphus jujuba]